MTNLSTDNKETLTMSTAVSNDNSSYITQKIAKSLKKRNAKEKRFRFLGKLAIAFGFAMVIILFVDITSKAHPAFFQHWIKVDINSAVLSENVDVNNVDVTKVSFRKVVKSSVYEMFPAVKGRSDKRKLVKLLSSDAEFELRDMLIEEPALFSTVKSVWLLADDDVDSYLKSDTPLGEIGGRHNSKQTQWLMELQNSGRLEKRFNHLFFTNSDSREPELAGIRGALMGTIFTMLVTLAISFPIGVFAALYLEEFAPKNRWTDIIEVNINNLAAVPSIVFGLLGLAIIINVFGLPRSAPLVGGIVLSLMTLPTIIIASRASIKAVPNSIREAAIGLGASNMQVTLGHVLPIAMPGILTGAIIGLAQALGETAPLLMIGMVAFIVDVPGSFTDAATVMPVQIFLWADSPEQAFLAKTSAAILVLLAFLLVMNFSATLLRSKFEKKGK
jgi:phosphate transport system permease protein